MHYGRECPKTSTYEEIRPESLVSMESPLIFVVSFIINLF